MKSLQKDINNKVLELAERAEKALDFWDAGSMWHRLVKRDLDANDMEALEFHLKEADSEQSYIQHAQEFERKFQSYLLGEEAELPCLLKDAPPIPGVKL